jgi:hypothetical protein
VTRIRDRVRGAERGFAALVTAVATDLLEARDELNRLDGVAGDGDLGSRCQPQLGQ